MTDIETVCVKIRPRNFKLTFTGQRFWTRVVRSLSSRQRGGSKGRVKNSYENKSRHDLESSEHSQSFRWWAQLPSAFRFLTNSMFRPLNRSNTYSRSSFESTIESNSIGCQRPLPLTVNGYSARHWRARTVATKAEKWGGKLRELNLGVSRPVALSGQLISFRPPQYVNAFVRNEGISRNTYNTWWPHRPYHLTP